MADVLQLLIQALSGKPGAPQTGAGGGRTGGIVPGSATKPVKGISTAMAGPLMQRDWGGGNGNLRSGEGGGGGGNLRSGEGRTRMTGAQANPNAYDLLADAVGTPASAMPVPSGPAPVEAIARALDTSGQYSRDFQGQDLPGFGAIDSSAMPQNVLGFPTAPMPGSGGMQRPGALSAGYGGIGAPGVTGLGSGGMSAPGVTGAGYGGMGLPGVTGRATEISSPGVESWQNIPGGEGITDTYRYAKQPWMGGGAVGEVDNPLQPVTGLGEMNNPLQPETLLQTPEQGAQVRSDTEQQMFMDFLNRYGIKLGPARG